MARCASHATSPYCPYLSSGPMDPWTLPTLARAPGPCGSFFGTFMMARSLLVPYLTGAGPYPGGPTLTHGPAHGTLDPISHSRGRPRTPPRQLGVYSQGPSGSARGSKGRNPDGSQHGTWPPWPPWTLWTLPRPYPSSLFLPTDLSQANGLQPT